ncbi:uncharacterized protein DS421_17g587870 [Arachis hypogaea]|nr:uncharacterized protein DS421_17g587870 [Arachis hypogaea]
MLDAGGEASSTTTRVGLEKMRLSRTTTQREASSTTTTAGFEKMRLSRTAIEKSEQDHDQGWVREDEAEQNRDRERRGAPQPGLGSRR